MFYPNFLKKKGFFIAILMIYVFIFSGVNDQVNAQDAKKNDENAIHFDFGKQPFGISQTTKKFYLCNSDAEFLQDDKTPSITVVEKKQEQKTKKQYRKIQRWNIPDSRSRVKMNRWLKKTKKNRTAIHIDAPYITGDHPDAFAIMENQCNQNTLLPGSTCQFFVSFNPINEGRQCANIIIPYSHNDNKKYYMLHVSGSAQKKDQSNIALIPK